MSFMLGSFTGGLFSGLQDTQQAFMRNEELKRSRMESQRQQDMMDAASEAQRAKDRDTYMARADRVAQTGAVDTSGAAAAATTNPDKLTGPLDKNGRPDLTAVTQPSHLINVGNVTRAVPGQGAIDAKDDRELGTAPAAADATTPSSPDQAMTSQDRGQAAAPATTSNVNPDQAMASRDSGHTPVGQLIGSALRTATTPPFNPTPQTPQQMYGGAPDGGATQPVAQMYGSPSGAPATSQQMYGGAPPGSAPQPSPAGPPAQLTPAQQQTGWNALLHPPSSPPSYLAPTAPGTSAPPTQGVPVNPTAKAQTGINALLHGGPSPPVAPDTRTIGARLLAALNVGRH